MRKNVLGPYYQVANETILHGVYMAHSTSHNVAPMLAVQDDYGSMRLVKPERASVYYQNAHH